MTSEFRNSDFLTEFKKRREQKTQYISDELARRKRLHSLTNKNAFEQLTHFDRDPKPKITSIPMEPTSSSSGQQNHPSTMGASGGLLRKISKEEETGLETGPDSRRSSLQQQRNEAKVKLLSSEKSTPPPSENELFAEYIKEQKETQDKLKTDMRNYAALLKKNTSQMSLLLKQDAQNLDTLETVMDKNSNNLTSQSTSIAKKSSSTFRFVLFLWLLIFIVVMVFFSVYVGVILRIRK